MQLLVLGVISIHHGGVVLLKILAVLDQAPTEDIDHYVGFPYVDQHVVLQNLNAKKDQPVKRNKYTYNWVFLSYKSSIAHSQVFDQESTC